MAAWLEIIINCRPCNIINFTNAFWKLFLETSYQHCLPIQLGRLVAHCFAKDVDAQYTDTSCLVLPAKLKGVGYALSSWNGGSKQGISVHQNNYH